MSIDPIGFVAGDANFYRYVGNSVTFANDVLGLAEKDCCACHIEELTIAPRKAPVTLLGERPVPLVGRKERGMQLAGSTFHVIIKLKYVPSENNEPCKLYWGENTSKLTSDNPYNLEENKWGNAYEAYPISTGPRLR